MFVRRFPPAETAGAALPGGEMSQHAPNRRRRGRICAVGNGHYASPPLVLSRLPSKGHATLSDRTGCARRATSGDRSIMIQTPSSGRRLFLLGVFLGALAGLLLLGRSAEAHAIIVSSTPAANSKMPQGPLDILLQFNSRIQIDLSRVDLVDPAGKVAALSIAEGNTGGSLTAQARADAAGKWTLRWQVLSVDGHITRGEIPFVVTDKTVP